MFRKDMVLMQEKSNKDIAKDVILNNLQSIIAKHEQPDMSIISEMFAIKNDDKILLEHLEMLKDIFEKAIKEIKDAKDL